MGRDTIIGIIPEYPKHSQQNIYGKIKMPPVGIVSVLSQLNDDLDIYIIDENNYSGPRDFIGNVDHSFLQKRKPAKIAMFYGGMSNSIPRMFSIAKYYQNQDVTTIAGGSHVDALPKEALNSGIDIVVHGGGEETAKEIVQIILNGERKNLENIVGISFLDEENNYIFTGKREPIKNLNELKIPNLALIKFLKKKWSAIPINKGRGCNFNCEFCVVNKQYGRYKSDSIEKVVEQIIRYSDLGYKNFFFTDDNFSQDVDETIELCKKIGDYKRKFKKKISLTVQVRSEIAENDELINFMKYAGVKTLAIGYESPINEELKAMRKGVNVEKLIKRSRKLSNHFYLHGMFIFGYPTFKDSKFKADLTLNERTKRYKKFFKKAKIDTIQVLNAVPLPGSELRKRLERERRIFPLESVGWDKYDGLFLCYRPETGIDAYELQNLPRILMKKKYLGNNINSKLNYGNWINWAYNYSIGFPIQFSIYYTKRFFHNLFEREREKNMENKKNLFNEPLVYAWMDMKRKLRNLTWKTYGGNLVKNWYKEYKKSDYFEKLKNLYK